MAQRRARLVGLVLQYLLDVLHIMIIQLNVHGASTHPSGGQMGYPARCWPVGRCVDPDTVY